MAFRNPATSGYRGRAPGPPRSARRFQQPVCQCRRCSTPSPWPVHAGQTTRCAVPGPISCWQPGHRYVFRAAGPGTVRTRKSPSAVERAVCQPAAGCAESSSHRSVATRRWARSGRWERRGTAERYPCVRVPGTMATSRTTTSTGKGSGCGAATNRDDPHRCDAQHHGRCAGRRGDHHRFQRAERVGSRPGRSIGGTFHPRKRCPDDAIGAGLAANPGRAAGHLDDSGESGGACRDSSGAGPGSGSAGHHLGSADSDSGSADGDFGGIEGVLSGVEGVLSVAEGVGGVCGFRLAAGIGKADDQDDAHEDRPEPYQPADAQPAADTGPRTAVLSPRREGHGRGGLECVLPAQLQRQLVGLAGRCRGRWLSEPPDGGHRHRRAAVPLPSEPSRNGSLVPDVTTGVRRKQESGGARQSRK